MDKLLKVKHQYNAGDLITILPGLKHIYETTGIKTTIYQELDLPAFYFDGLEHPIKDESGKQVCMNEDMFNRLWYLISKQQYIHEFLVWYGEKTDFDMAKTRDSRAIPMPAGSIFHWPFMTFPDLACDLSKPWLEVPESPNADYLKDKIIINRTERYTNPYISYFFLKEYQDRLLFIGTVKEYELFLKKYDLHFGLLRYDDFLGYASAVKACKLFIGNQSFFWHCAHGMNKLSILELCNEFPNCWPMNGNSYAFLYQDALEHYFRKLIN